MRKRLIPIAIATTVAAGVAAVPLAASGDDDREVTIGVRLNFAPDGTATGSFAACCELTDSGAAQAQITSFTPKRNRAAFEATNTFDGVKGSFTILLRGTTGPLDSPVHIARARWQVIAGSGAYERLRGHGRVTATTNQGNGELTAIDVGEVRGVDEAEDD